MTLTMSCVLVPEARSAEYARIAEDLGYARAWFYDSPALYSDVWVRMCQAAERTDRIGLGTGVMVPSNRHPLTTASAIATLVDVAGPTGYAWEWGPVSRRGWRWDNRRCAGGTWSGTSRRCRACSAGRW
ncbi:LLM class flavin-dependent oxidoreductase [[Mycobacterium] wendilense]|uniref:LLM class flavin-dependent oxidoreductase n=1 Tax=[Mycobacterium] wendilense TaxID=3064284 RepID=A0ABN9NW73_9MYCO|nr:LLM class flavin-dependent oxidoreductase [Mycolicibacterium sp. MU0050]CAJ1581085.1 LLM class flavin-dependent oxidoreductase [Mycolicibacterium sp. MU0050]